MPYPHIVYICAAYVVTTFVVGVMIAAILIDKHRLERELTRLSALKDSETRS